MDVMLKHRFVQRSSTRAVSDEISIARLYIAKIYCTVDRFRDLLCLLYRLQL